MSYLTYQSKNKIMLFIIYLVSVTYCIFKMYRSYKKRGIDPIYATPGLETMAIIAMAPVLMAVDVSMTWIRVYKEAEESRIRRNKIEFDFTDDKGEIF